MNDKTASKKRTERVAKLLADRIRQVLKGCVREPGEIERLLGDDDATLRNIARGALNTVLEAERLGEDRFSRIIANVQIPELFADETLSKPYVVAVNCAATRLGSFISVTVSALAEEFDLELTYLTNVLGMCEFRTPDGTSIPLFRLIRHAHDLAPTLVQISSEAYAYIHPKQPSGFPSQAFNG